MVLCTNLNLKQNNSIDSRSNIEGITTLFFLSIINLWRNLLLINKDRSRIKVFKPFADISKPSLSIDAMMISYGSVYKRSSKPIMKGSRVETLEAARKEYKQLLDEGWKKNSIFRSNF